MLRAWPRWALLSLLIGPILVGGHPARALVLDEDWRVNVHWEDPEIVAAFTMRIELDDRRWPFFGTVVSLLKGNIQLYETGTVQWDFSTATFSTARGLLEPRCRAPCATGRATPVPGRPNWRPGRKSRPAASESPAPPLRLPPDES